jgi:DNA modification methylase
MTVRILQGDCRAVLTTLDAESVQCVVTSPPYFGLRSYLPEGHADKPLEIGLEQTPEGYVAAIVAVFREVWRVLRKDGTVWLNLGDSYNAYNGNRGPGAGINKRHDENMPRIPQGAGLTVPNLKNKDRLMIPARVAIALQVDGWYLRDEIVWHKPRPMPSPVRDRTVNAHEMVYLLTKAPRYFYDWEAIEEPSSYPGQIRKAGKAFRDLDAAGGNANAVRKRPSADREIVVRDTRRARSVWSICPSPYTDSHFATMPQDLAERCIRAGSKQGDTILDPFGGAGTTGLVADRLGRNGILIDLRSDYVDMQRRRVVDDAGMFAQVVAQ